MAPKSKLNTPENTTVISLDGTIGWWEADARWLKRELKGAQNVIFKVNSGGGSVMDANEMYNVLNDHPYNVRVEIGALAASAAGYLALAGDEVVTHKNSTWMGHPVQGFAFGTADDMDAEADLMRGLQNIIATTISDATGKKLADVQADLAATKWLFGGEAIVEYGIASEVMDNTDEAEEAEVDEATNKLEVRRVHENTLQKFAENPENLRQAGNNFSNFLKEQKSEVSHKTNEVTPSNGVLTMPEENNKSTVDARNEGMETERARTTAWLKFNDLDADYVAKGIESGAEMNSADVAHFTRKSLDRNAEQSLINNTPAPVEPEETEIPAADEVDQANEAGAKWLNKYTKDGE